MPRSTRKHSKLLRQGFKSGRSATGRFVTGRSVIGRFVGKLFFKFRGLVVSRK
jgi:hypothetical protein